MKWKATKPVEAYNYTYKRHVLCKNDLILRRGLFLKLHIDKIANQIKMMPLSAFVSIACGASVEPRFLAFKFVSLCSI